MLGKTSFYVSIYYIFILNLNKKKKKICLNKQQPIVKYRIKYRLNIDSFKTKLTLLWFAFFESTSHEITYRE